MTDISLPTILTRPDQPHHITCVVHDLLPVFSQPAVVNIIFDSWRKLREQCGLRLYGYVVMEEHLHFLAQAERLDVCLSTFREDTASRVVTYLKEQRLERFLKRLLVSEGEHQQYRFWQETPETELITEDGIMCATLDYIHINPVKRGYVDHAGQWRYSSARNYAGKGGVIEVDLWGDEPRSALLASE